MSQRPPIGLRYATAADEPFIIDSWMRCNKSHSPLVQHVDSRAYETHHRPLVRQLVERSQTFVAYATAVPDELVGFICGDRSADTGLVVHFVYVKRAYRRVGVARELLRGLGYERGEVITATHITYLQTEGRLRAYLVRNDPYLLYKQALEDVEDVA